MSPRRRAVVTGLVVAVVAALVVVVVVIVSQVRDGGGAGRPSPSSTSTSIPTAGATPVAPGSDDGQAASDQDAPSEGEADGGQPAPPVTAAPTAAPVEDAPTPTRSVSIFVPAASWEPSENVISAAGIVEDLVETGGTCTLRASAPGQETLTTSVRARGDATATYCGTMTVPLATGTTGTYSVVVEYLSTTSSGRSSASSVAVG